MQKRFTPSDYTLFAILSVLFLTLILTMYMIDRQWTKLAEMESRLKEQAGDTRELRKSMKSIERRVKGGASSFTSSDAQSDEIPQAFERAQQMTQLSDYAEGDWYVQAQVGGLKTITPYISTDYDASIIQGYVLETLLKYNPDTLEPEGKLADSWSISKDGLTFVFKLRQDVIFSDGVRMTADDVVFTFNYVMNEKIAAPKHRAYYGRIKKVKAIDKYTVSFEYKEPYFDSLMLAGQMNILAKHHYQKFLDDPTTYNKSKGFLFGSGPYRLKGKGGWSPEKGLVELDRNPRYWGPVTPSYDKLLWKPIAHDSARLTAFRNGEIDGYVARPIEYKKLKNDSHIKKIANNFEYTYQTAGYMYIGWNQLKEGKATRFSDKRVREAMTYLIDRQRVIDEIYLGYGDVAAGPFNPLGFQHNPEVKPRAYDPEKARALLKEAGYEDRDGNGVIEDKAGKPFEFELIYFRDSDDYKRLSLLLKDMMAKAGIILKLKPTEWPVMLEKTDSKQFDAMMLAWSASVEGDLYQIFHSSQALQKGDNYISYKNEKLDKLIEQARSTVDKQKRIKLWQQCEKILYEDQPYTFLSRRKALVFMNKRIHNLSVTKFGMNTKETPIETYVPAALQKYTK